MSLLHRIAIVALTPLLLAAEDRIHRPVDSGRSIVLRNHVLPLAQRANDRGRVAASQPISYVTLMMKPAATLDRFLVEQQTPGSPNYRRWLTPEQFGERFGLSTN